MSTDSKESRRLFLRAGTLYGLIFGLSFSLLCWGYDAVLITQSHAEFAWVKLLLGLPLTVIIFTLAGRLIAATSAAAVQISLGAGAGVLLGIIVGHLPYEGNNLAAWVADNRLWGLVVFPYGESAAAWTTLVAIAGGGIGALFGFLESLIVERAWDRATPDLKLSKASLASLLLCIPLVLVYVGMAEELVNQRLRLPQQRVSQLIEFTLNDATQAEFDAHGISGWLMEPYRNDLSEDYTIHLASYSSEMGYTSTYVDAAFADGPVIRCSTTEIGGFFSYNQRVIFCEEILPTYAEWTNQLITAALTGERVWLEDRQQPLEVEDTVVRWMESRSDQFSESYELARPSQRASWVFISARFETGFEMVCRFYGAAPVRVDQCIEAE
jgi:hypothetical protein